MLTYLRNRVKAQSPLLAECLEEAASFHDALVDMIADDEVGPKEVRRYIRLEILKGTIPPILGRRLKTQVRRSA